MGSGQSRKQIAQGGFGKAYLVKRNGQWIVLKEFHRPVPEQRRRIMDRLADTLRELDPKEKLFLPQRISKDGKSATMTYGGQDLIIYLNEVTLLTNFTAAFNLMKAMRNVFAALCLLHEHNIVHGDIRLENLVYDAKTVRIIDLDYTNTIQGYTQWQKQHRNARYPNADVRKQDIFYIHPPQRAVRQMQQTQTQQDVRTYLQHVFGRHGEAIHVTRRIKQLRGLGVNADQWIDAVDKLTLKDDQVADRQKKQQIRRKRQQARVAYDKIDVYSLGIALFDIFVRQESFLAHVQSFLELVANMVQPDHEHRIDICRASKAYKSIVDDVVRQLQHPER